MLSPLYSSLCYRRYIDETFNITADPQLEVKHWVWPSSVPLWERKRTWVIEPALGTMLGNSSADPCTRKRAIGTFYGPVSNMWSTLAPQPNQLVSRTMANISLLTPSSVAGVAVRIQDERNMYLAEVRTRNITLVRIVGGIRTVLAIRPLNYTMEGGAWGRFGICTQHRQVWVTQDDPTPGSNITTTIVNMTDSAPLLTPAGSALYLAPDSLVRFDNFGVDVGCDLGNVVRWAHSSMQVLFTCKPGFTPVGNLTWTCLDGVRNYGNSYLICLSQVRQWNATCRRQRLRTAQRLGGQSVLVVSFHPVCLLCSLSSLFTPFSSSALPSPTPMPPCSRPSPSSLTSR